MIEEAYVSFEIARLLKKKGFDEPCVWAYDPNRASFAKNYFTPKNSELNEYEYSKPTLQMAMKWLREVHNIDIFPWKIGKGIYSCAIFNSNTGQDLSSDKDFPSEKYEEAAEAAVKYCLENLI